ncbi:MAG: ion transporter [Bacteroidales bacterium]
MKEIRKKSKIASLFLNDHFILLLILVNSISLFAEGFHDLGAQSLFYIALIDSVITFLFLIEAVVKILHFGWKTYISLGWNQLDFILLVFSLPSIFLLIVHGSMEGLSFLLIFRVSRVFKFFRFFRFIPGFNQLLNGVKRALKTSVFVLFGFFVFNFIISVLSCYLFRDLSPEYFGNPLQAMYSIFRVFTIDGWYDIPDNITMNSSDFMAVFIKLYFVIILVIGGILGLSLVNSIFVDSMVMDNTDELERKVDLLNEKLESLIKKLQEK